jgi:speckle-type POZ protein
VNNEGNAPKPRIKVNNEGNATLKSLFQNPDFSDITFLVGDDRFIAHKAVLVVSCKYFENLFTSGMRESQMKEIRVTDVSSAVFKSILF